MSHVGLSHFQQVARKVYYQDVQHTEAENIEYGSRESTSFHAMLVRYLCSKKYTSQISKIQGETLVVIFE